jgi:hypothetical protein
MSSRVNVNCYAPYNLENATVRKVLAYHVLFIKCCLKYAALTRSLASRPVFSPRHLHLLTSIICVYLQHWVIRDEMTQAAQRNRR